MCYSYSVPYSARIEIVEYTVRCEGRKCEPEDIKDREGTSADTSTVYEEMNRREGKSARDRTDGSI